MKTKITALLATTALALHTGTVIAQEHTEHPDDHAGRSEQPSAPAPAPSAQHEHASMGHGSMDRAATDQPTPANLPLEPIAPLTDADRAAAFPELASHASHDTRKIGFVQLERLETWDAGDGSGLRWEAQGWYGGDLDKLWLRTEGERSDGTTEASDLELLYGRPVARWWDLLVGVRHDFDPGSSQSWAAIGLVGLAPQKFEIEATAYVGDAGRSALRFEAGYELLLTNRLIAQPLLELNLLGKDDPARRLGSGVTAAEIGVRLRYEVTRQFAPYLGVTYERAYGDTADLRRSDGEHVDDTRVVAGVRAWF